MPAGTATETFRTAVEHHQAGRLAQAEALYRQVLSEHPNDGDALHLMGVLAYQEGRLQLARDLVQRAINRQPDAAPYHRNLGLILTAQEKLPEAVAAFETCVKLKPDFAEAYANLGYALLQLGRKADALKAIGRASELQPRAVEIAGLHARLLLQEGRAEESICALKSILARRPEQAAVWNELGIALKMKGQAAEAISAWREALRLKPDFTGAMSNLAIALLAENRVDESVDLARQLIARSPEEPAGHLTLGAALLHGGDALGAIAPLRKAAELQPDSAEAHARLAGALIASGSCDQETRAALTRAIELNPRSAPLRNRLGEIELASGRHDEALERFQSAIKQDERSCEGWRNLARAYFEVGEIEESADCFQRAIEIDPNNLDIRSRWIFALHHHPDADTTALLEEARKWESTRASRNFGARPNPPQIEGSTARFLRVGFVIPPHADEMLLKLFPLFRRHNHEQFHFYAYSDIDKDNVITGKLRPLVRKWQEIASLTNQQIASQIRQDHIDILLDLAQHAEGHRLPAFAANCAPLQITYGLYPGTTGLSTIEYRLTDSHLDSLPSAQIASEKSVVLPNCYWCWDPEALEDAEEPATPLSASVKGYVTFGALGTPEKLNDELIDAWGKILKATAGSRLLLPALPERTRKRITKKLGEHEVAAERLEFASDQSCAENAKLLARIDIVLDPFPFCGISSSLKSLWMGAPIVTLAGQTPVGRIGLSFLANLDLRELAAESAEQYVEIASELARDLSRLGELRAGLRQRMLESPLTDARRFARNFEAILRDLWEREVASS